MVNTNKKSTNSKKIIKEKQGKILDSVTKNYVQTIDHGKQFGKKSLKKINKGATDGNEFLKSQQYWKLIKDKSLQIKKKSSEQRSLLEKQGPKFYKKISNGFFYFFELIIGRIKLGTQYGTPSLDVLEKLAKLKDNIDSDIQINSENYIIDEFKEIFIPIYEIKCYNSKDKVAVSRINALTGKFL